MKTILSVAVNGIYSDVVIESFQRAIKVDGKDVIVSQDENGCVVKCKGSIRGVSIYSKNKDNSKKSKVIYMNASAIKNLYDKIFEIESTETEESEYYD